MPCTDFSPEKYPEVCVDTSSLGPPPGGSVLMCWVFFFCLFLCFNSDHEIISEQRQKCCAVRLVVLDSLAIQYNGRPDEQATRPHNPTTDRGSSPAPRMHCFSSSSGVIIGSRANPVSPCVISRGQSRLQFTLHLLAWFPVMSHDAPGHHHRPTTKLTSKLVSVFLCPPPTLCLPSTRGRHTETSHTGKVSTRARNHLMTILPTMHWALCGVTSVCPCRVV